MSIAVELIVLTEKVLCNRKFYYHCGTGKKYFSKKMQM
jgi:hypothetical protein